MKKHLLLLALAAGLFVTAAAQKPFQGTVKSKISIEGTTDPNILANVPESSETIILGNKSKTVYELGGGGASQTIIQDGDFKIMYVIIEVPGMGKYYIKTTKEDFEKKHVLFKYDFSYEEEYKTIVGYNCQKVVITTTNLEDDEMETVIVYVTKDPAFSDGGNFFETPGLNGYPMYSESKKTLDDGSEITIIEETTELIPNKKLKVLDFYLPSDAKDLKQDKDAQKMFGINLDEEQEEE
ncbi:MAG: hypothetical protein LBL18_00375 [Bacteroidales bacterium]|jgi:hypothetical protein|nr:hypothetical protein [Bacteroidales bacterium]